MKSLRDYLIVTVAYWSFMLTDGALRMLVLLYFHERGYSTLSLAFLFLLYEFCGIVTNAVGGWLAARQGLKVTLVAGLALQVGGILMLACTDPSWPLALGVCYVMVAQSLSGIAKDLTKMSAKTAVKFLVPEDQGSRLYKWVAVLTGSKNAIKGAGFFLGGLLLQVAGFRAGLWGMGVFIAVICLASWRLLPGRIGQPKSKTTKLSGLFAQGRRINLLATSRVFLFGARDIWFVVGLPVYLGAELGWSFSQVGGFMALWVVGYGAVQMVAPGVTRWRSGGAAPGGRLSFELVCLLLVVMLGITSAVAYGVAPGLSIVVGLFVFGAVFALNSSVHSFLILDYADGDKAAMSVGFYYMANAIGRLLGTLLSGLLYQAAGLIACLVGASVFLAITAAVTWLLPHQASARAVALPLDVGGSDA